MHVGLLGGSFDPVHHGHLLAAIALREKLGLDQVRLIPVCSQPLKGGRHEASPQDRVRMVELAVEGEPGLVADRQEVERGGVSYTVDTVRALADQHPEAQLTVLIGSDAAAEFGDWKEAETLRSLAEVVVFSRGGTVTEVPGFRVVPVPLVELSATEIRARVRQGLSIRFMVPDRVAEYIAARRLYRSEVG